jgi:putative hemolysin
MGEYHTVAGFVLDQLGHLPKVGESVVFRGHTFEVVDMDGRRIDEVLVSAVPEADPAAT